MQTRRLHRPAMAVAGALALLLCIAGTASAHVTVQPPEVPQGGFAKLTFRVPNERDNAATTGLRVQLPQDHAFTSVSVKPKQGWTVEVTPRTLDTPLDNHGEQVTEVASEISWTGGRIEPGEFDEFEISVGRIPTDVDELYFPAIQIYDNGEEVSWIEVPTTSGEELENPAPALTLVAAGDDEQTATPAAATDGVAAGGSSSDDGDGNGLAIAALVVGGVAIVLSIVALATKRRPA